MNPKREIITEDDVKPISKLYKWITSN